MKTNYAFRFFRFISYLIFRFRVDLVKSAIQEVLNDELSSKQYDAEETTKWSKEISDTIKDKLKSRLCLSYKNNFR